MNLSHHSEPIRQRCRPAAYIGQPLDHSVEFKAPIEPVGERAEIPPQVLAMDGVVRAVDRVLHIAEQGYPNSSSPTDFADKPVFQVFVGLIIDKLVKEAAFICRAASEPG